MYLLLYSYIETAQSKRGDEIINGFYGAILIPNNNKGKGKARIVQTR